MLFASQREASAVLRKRADALGYGDKDFFSAAEAALILEQHHESVRRHMRSGKIGHFRLGSRFRTSLEALSSYLYRSQPGLLDEEIRHG